MCNSYDLDAALSLTVEGRVPEAPREHPPEAFAKRRARSARSSSRAARQASVAGWVWTVPASTCAARRRASASHARSISAGSVSPPHPQGSLSGTGRGGRGGPQGVRGPQRGVRRACGASDQPRGSTESSTCKVLQGTARYGGSHAPERRGGLARTMLRANRRGLRALQSNQLVGLPR